METIEEKNVDEILDSYIECIIWCEEFESCTISPESKKQAIADIEKLLSLVGNKFDGWSESEIGHDFYLTRNGHGVGFWDREKEYGEEITSIVDANFKEVDAFFEDYQLILD